MVDAVNAGHKVTASDEEVLACACESCFLSGMGPTASNNIDLFFANNNEHSKVLKRQYPKLVDKLIVSGNPRIDLSSSWGKPIYNKEAIEISNKFGPYILFNTNFGWINSIWSKREDPREIAIRTGHLIPDNKESIAEYQNELHWEKYNMIEMEKVINWLDNSKFQQKIIIRPHPAEDPNYWKEKYKKSKKIIIIDKSSPIPWILGSQILIHSTCSTGMEAALMEKPALSITPNPDKKQHSYILSNFVNPTVKDFNNAKIILSNFLEQRHNLLTENKESQKKLKNIFPFFGLGKSASIIADSIFELYSRNNSTSPDDYKWSLRNGVSWETITRRIEWKEKFSVSTEELVKRLESIGNLIKINKNINLQKIEDSLFIISCDN